MLLPEKCGLESSTRIRTPVNELIIIISVEFTLKQHSYTSYEWNYSDPIGK